MKRTAIALLLTLLCACNPDPVGPDVDVATTLEVQPASISILVADQQPLTAVVKSKSGSPLSDAQIQWSSEDTSIVSITGSIASGKKAGATRLRAQSGGLSATVDATVTQRPVGALTISGLSPDVEFGAPIQLQATVRDDQGTLLTDRSITWTSSDTMIAAVSAAGLLRLKALGSFSIVASSGNRQATSNSRSVLPTIGLPLTFRSRVVDGGVVQVGVSRTLRLSDTLPAFVNSVLVQAVPVDDSTATLIIPVGTGASAVIRVGLPSGWAGAPATVVSNPVIGPPAARVTQLTDSLLAAIPVTAPLGADAAEWSRMRRTADSLTLDIRTRVGQMSPALQSEFAALMQSLTVSSPEPQVRPSSVGLSFSDCEFRIAKYYSLLIRAILVFALVAGAMKTIINPIFALTGLAAAFLLAISIKADLRTEVLNLQDSCTVPTSIQAEFGSASQVGSMLASNRIAPARPAAVTDDRWMRGVSKSIKFVGKLEGLNQGTITVFPGAARMVGQWDAVSSAEQKLPSDFRFGAGAVPPSPSTVPSGTGRQVTHEGTSLSIGSVVPSSVTVSVTKSADGWLVRADSPDPTEIPFSFDVFFTDRPSVRTTISGTLEADVVVTLSTLPSANLTGVLQTFQNGATELGCSHQFVVTVTGPGTITMLSWNGSFSYNFSQKLALTGTSAIPRSAGTHQVPWRVFSSGSSFNVSYYIEYRDNNRNVVKTTNSRTVSCLRP